MKITPSPEQQDILDLGLTSIRVRAGAGTGKTTTVAMVISNLVATHGLEPERILGLTFTNKAASELAERVTELMSIDLDGARQVEVHTYHGFAAQILSEFGPLAGIDSRSGVITPTFARQLIYDVFYRGSYQYLDMTYSGTIDRIRRLGAELGDHLLAPSHVLRGADGDDQDLWRPRLEMLEVLERYQEAKEELGVVDFSDLVTVSARLLGEHPALARTVRDRYHVLVLDEYQDTNPAQRVLLTTIFGGGFPVVGVGDEDQTIYEWRGASPENFDRFGEHFLTPEGEPAHDMGLTLNRRSGAEILSVANEVRIQASPGADHLSPVDDHASSVTTYWAGDAFGEAEWIARQFEHLRDQGHRWSEMAVLLRKNKDFAVLIDVLGRHDIPIEVANVGGMLTVPEISYLRAWLLMLDNPDNSTALSEILFGSDYRLGIADLAVLTRWTSSLETGDSEEPEPVTLIEAIEHLDRVETLSPIARRRLERFRDIYRKLLVDTQSRSLAEICRRILEETGSWQHIEALPKNARLTARLNVYRFLDHADDWSPLAGRPSLSAFLDYLTAMEDEPSDQLDAARLSGEEAVTLVTVHRAKGLEWDTVAVPGVVKGNFPASVMGGYPDPYGKPQYLPPEFRLDESLRLPEDETARRAYLRERHETGEWRVAYVAVTRARRHLFVTGANWYGVPEPNKRPSEPSELFQLVDSSPVSIDAGKADPGPRPTMLRLDEDTPSPDPLFPDGWQTFLRSGLNDPSNVSVAAEELGIREEVAASRAEWAGRLFDLADIPETETAREAKSVSVTGLVTYAQCPKRFFWNEVDPLPRKRNPAAIRGSQVHRRIELHQRGQVPIDDFDIDLYDHEPTSGPGAYSAYESSRFGNQRAAAIEAPFVIETESGYQVRGRVDAIYRDGGHWEVVDFKSGRPKTDPSRIVQLQAYAVATSEMGFGMGQPNTLDVTFAYLGDGLTEEVTRADEDWVREARMTLERLTTQIDSGSFDASPGPWCANCDFLRFCEPGRQQVEG